MLEIQNLTKTYRNKQALCDFSANLDNGIYGLLGPNGAGKSTLLRTLVMLQKPTVGEILLDGKSIRVLRGDYLKKLGYMPQNPGFYGSFSAADYLRYFAAVKGIPRTKQKSRIAELLTFVNLTGAAESKIRTFSGGMKQRLAIAAALLNDPKLLILDEPTAGLDVHERIRFRRMLAGLSEQRIILIATHIVSDVEAIANEIILLKDGRKRAQDSPEHLLAAMRGKVWTLEIPQAALHDAVQQYQVSNAKHHGQTYTLRILSDEQPAGAVPAEPSLDDVYLDLCGGTSL